MRGPYKNRCSQHISIIGVIVGRTQGLTQAQYKYTRLSCVDIVQNERERQRGESLFGIQCQQVGRHFGNVESSQ